MKLSSGSKILLILSWEFRIVLQKISRRVVGNVLINIFPSNAFPTKLLPEIFYLICQAVLAAVSINGSTQLLRCMDLSTLMLLVANLDNTK